MDVIAIFNFHKTKTLIVLPERGNAE